MKVLTCASPYGQGGIGQHFAQLVEEARAEGALAHYYAVEPRQGDESISQSVSLREVRWLARYTPLRWSPSWINYLDGELFDYRVAARLSDVEGKRLVAFAGRASRSFERARQRGAEALDLIVPNSHVDNLKRLHEQAHRETGVRDTWLNEAQRRKTLKEYDRADVIHVHSEYVRQSFLEAGVPADKLRRMTLHVDEHFEPPSQRPGDEVFRVVYVGRVDATKGVPLLVEAFSRLESPAELTIVGSWATRAMRKYMQEQLQRDPRIQMAPGDPLPALQRADVFVHPTFEDGFGYAPMEALACGVPVIATEDTGMKEYIEPGQNGYVVPTGSREALSETMKRVRQHPLAAPRDLRLASSAESTT